jgi:hypothetical protein
MLPDEHTIPPQMARARTVLHHPTTYNLHLANLSAIGSKPGTIAGMHTQVSAGCMTTISKYNHPAGQDCHDVTIGAGLGSPAPLAAEAAHVLQAGLPVLVVDDVAAQARRAVHPGPAVPDVPAAAAELAVGGMRTA